MAGPATSIQPGTDKEIPSFCNRLEIGLRWDSGAKPSFDLDSSVLIYKKGSALSNVQANTQPEDSDQFAYVAYNKREASHNGKVIVQHQGDSTSGGGDGEADNEAIRFWLDRLPDDAVCVVVVTVFTEGKTYGDLDNIDVRMRTFKDQEEQFCGLGKCCSPSFFTRCLTCPSLPCGSCCGQCVGWPMSKIGHCMAAIKRAFACFESCGCSSCAKCKGPSSFFKSPFKAPPERNTGCVVLKIFKRMGNWNVHGYNRYFDENANGGQRFKRGYDLIPSAQQVAL
eukprot:c32182_g1_i1.p1 GENE.c32182_g1_i1~~c32182_g1_i1.p1  ORF type:complete len:282 (+),score=56.26 c32182_g1_i1:41-886(+)